MTLLGIGDKKVTRVIARALCHSPSDSCRLAFKITRWCMEVHLVCIRAFTMLLLVALFGERAEEGRKEEGGGREEGRDAGV